MRRITLWLLSTVAVLVLLFSYRTSTMSGDTSTTTPLGAGTAGGSTSSGAGTSNGSTSGGSGSSGSGSSGSSAASGSGSSGSRTYTGSEAQTQWGPVRVRITVAGGRITAVSVPTYPNGNPRDAQINAYALPILAQEVVSAQSADIDTVSGATVTSDGYKQSLQAAIDAAHL